MKSDVSRRNFLALLGGGLMAGTARAQGQSGKRLFAYVASWTSGPGSIVTFAVDGESGRLTPTGAKVDVPRPVCVQFAAI